MKVLLYRMERKRLKNVIAIGTGFLNYGISICMEIEEAKELGIQINEISKDMESGKFYRTDNDCVVNLLSSVEDKFYFAQFLVKKNKVGRNEFFAGKNNYNSNYLQLLLGNAVTRKKITLYMLYMFPKSPYYGNKKDAILETLRLEIENKNIHRNMINDKFIERVFKQKWWETITESPIGKFIMSNLKMALKEVGVDYSVVIRNYRNIAENEEDLKAAVAANKELERLVVQSIEEDNKQIMINQIANNEIDSMEVPKRLNGEVVSEEIDDLNKIMEVGEELEIMGNDYINQNMDEEEFVIEEK